jgi:hypothetical protein
VQTLKGLLQIVVGAHIRITPPNAGSQSPAIYAGQPIAATVFMHTSFHWSSTEHDSKKTLTMRFDIGGMTQDWLISGCKRGDFEAKVGLFEAKQQLTTHPSSGWRCVQCTHHAGRLASWTNESSSSSSITIPSGWHHDHGFNRIAKHRHAPDPWGRKNSNSASRREKYICR